MKSIKIIFLSCFILGLIIFQTNFISENGNSLSKIGISLTAQALGEGGSGSYYTPSYRSVNCGTSTWEMWTYYYNNGDVAGTKKWVNGVLQVPFFEGTGYIARFTSGSESITGTATDCNGGVSSCTPYSGCPQ